MAQTAPQAFGLEPTLGCNLRCPICAVGCGRVTRKKPKFLTLDSYKVIADNIKPYAKTVMLYNQGEPLLNPDIYDIIEDVQTYARPLIHTNGCTSNINYDRLAESNADIVVCIDGISQAVYRKYRVGGQLHDALTTLLVIASKRRKIRSAASIMAQFLLFKHNQHELLSYLHVMVGLDIPVRVKLPQIDLNPVLGPHTLEQFPGSEKPMRHRTSCTPGCIKNCSYITTDMVSLSDGGVVSCCFDYNGDNRFGNLLEQSVMDIWNSERFAAFKQQVRSDSPPEFCAKNCLNAPESFVYFVSGQEQDRGRTE